MGITTRISIDEYGNEGQGAAIKSTNIETSIKKAINWQPLNNMFYNQNFASRFLELKNSSGVTKIENGYYNYGLTLLKDGSYYFTQVRKDPYNYYKEEIVYYGIYDDNNGFQNGLFEYFVTDLRNNTYKCSGYYDAKSDNLVREYWDSFDGLSESAWMTISACSLKCNSAIKDAVTKISSYGWKLEVLSNLYWGEISN